MSKEVLKAPLCPSFSPSYAYVQAIYEGFA